MRIQIISVVVSICFLLFVLRLVIKEKISEAYSLLWIFLGIIFFLLSIWRPLVDDFGRLIGIYYTPTAFLLVMIFCLILVLIQYSIVISSQTNKIRKLSQELGLLTEKVLRMEMGGTTKIIQKS